MRGAAERFISDKARIASILNSFKNDPFYIHLVTLFTVIGSLGYRLLGGHAVYLVLQLECNAFQSPAVLRGCGRATDDICLTVWKP